jgi:hypothetical protein
MSESMGIAKAFPMPGAERAANGTRRPAITDRWIRTATVANRIAFEQEMKRERRSTVDSRLKRFLKQGRARQA